MARPWLPAPQPNVKASAVAASNVAAAAGLATVPSVLRLIKNLAVAASGHGLERGQRRVSSQKSNAAINEGQGRAVGMAAGEGRFVRKERTDVADWVGDDFVVDHQPAEFFVGRVGLGRIVVVAPGPGLNAAPASRE